MLGKDLRKQVLTDYSVRMFSRVIRDLVMASIAALDFRDNMLACHCSGHASFPVQKTYLSHGKTLLQHENRNHLMDLE